MIDSNTYITILFTIIIGSLGFFITISTQDMLSSKKRVINIVILFITLVLIILATLLHITQKETLKNFISTLSISNFFNIMHFPFNSPEFSIQLYKNAYFLGFFIFLAFHFIIWIMLCIINKFRKKHAAKKPLLNNLIWLIVLAFIISLYPYMWGSYVLFNLWFDNTYLYSNYIAQIIITIISILIEMRLLYVISTLVHKIRKYILNRNK